jgi:prolyl-tRNA editing enzyme YbaK/EbsC (Cys-tRNA(Pro) deacylase)
MHPRAEEFAECAAAEHGIEVVVEEFDEGTKTAEDAAAVVDCDVAQIASGLVFAADGDPVMVITSGANRVNEDRLAAHLGADAVEMADPELVRAATGYGIGGVPPFCHERHVPVLLDPTLRQFDEVWAAAGTPQAVFPIDPDELVAAADATPADVTE